MYPTAELNELARRKIVLRARVGASRLVCVTYAAEVARPIGLVDRVVTQWRRISPAMKLLALTLGFVLRRKWRARQVRKASTLRGLLRLLPLVLSLARGMARYRR
jgi:hypothetical protein